MLDSVRPQPAPVPTALSAKPHHILVGVTNAQSCLLLPSRLRAFREAGFRVTLVSTPGAMLDSTAANQAVTAVAIPMKRTIAPFSDLLSLYRLWRLLRRIRPDLVEFSTPKAGLLGAIASLLCGVPVRVYMLRGLKLETATGFKRRILLAAERMASACAHVVICNSQSLRAQALALRIAPEAKLHLLGDGSSHGVDVEHFSPGRSTIRKDLGIPDAAMVLGFVGRLTRDKGVPELVEAFDAILPTEPDAHLILVGWFDAAEDALDRELRARIMGHPRIHYTGLVPDAAPYYRAMDVMVLPTLREGFPNVVLEAAATGIPAITTLSTGARDAVVPEVTGLLIPPGYPEALREALLKLVCNPELRFRMGQASRDWVIAHYANERVMGLTVEFYRGLLRTSVANPPG